MNDAGCSGSQPFKSLINHHDYDRSLPSTLATKPNVAPNVGKYFHEGHHPPATSHSSPQVFRVGHRARVRTNCSQTFRGPSTSPEHGRYNSFMGGGDGSSTPIPTLAATPALAGTMTGAITGGHAAFPTHQRPHYHQNADHLPQRGWAQEYLRQSSASPASQNDHASYRPSIAPTDNRSMQGSSSRLDNGTYSGHQVPYMGHGFPVAAQPVRAPEHAAEMSEWMGAHRPSGLAFEDVDQVLDQISGELDELVVEAEPERELQSAAEQGERGRFQNHADSQATETPGSETSQTGADGRTAVSHLARKILQAVDHEADEKWMDSSFLALMRDFRDGRKDVSENTIEVVTTG